MWFAYSLFFALWTSISMLVTKHLLKSIKPIPLVVIIGIFAIPSMLILILYLGIPTTSIDFYKFVLASAILDSIAAYATFKALSISPVSLLAPISTFNPIFTLFFAYIFLGENVTQIKLLGIIIIIIGAYLLNVADIKGGILKPFYSLFFNKGVLLTLFATFLWGITPILQKQAIFETNPQIALFPAFIGLIFVTIILTPFAIKSGFSSLSLKKNLKWFLFLGVMLALASYAAFTAFSLANLAYVTSIFKLSALFTIILGAIFFKEKRIKERFLGAAVMVAGTFLLVL